MVTDACLIAGGTLLCVVFDIKNISGINFSGFDWMRGIGFVDQVTEARFRLFESHLSFGLSNNDIKIAFGDDFIKICSRFAIQLSSRYLLIQQQAIDRL